MVSFCQNPRPFYLSPFFLPPLALFLQQAHLHRCNSTPRVSSSSHGKNDFVGCMYRNFPREKENKIEREREREVRERMKVDITGAFVFPHFIPLGVVFSNPRPFPFFISNLQPYCCAMHICTAATPRHAFHRPSSTVKTWVACMGFFPARERERAGEYHRSDCISPFHASLV